MFFVGGISQGTKELLYQAVMFVCDRCGRYGRYQVFMTYSYLSLFFIPVFKWNRRYFAKSTCCGTVYEINQEIGQRIARGEELQLRPEHLNLISDGHQAPAWQMEAKRCANCGYETKENFDFCPKCGNRF